MCHVSLLPATSPLKRSPQPFDRVLDPLFFSGRRKPPNSPIPARSSLPGTARPALRRALRTAPRRSASRRAATPPSPGFAAHPAPPSASSAPVPGRSPSGTPPPAPRTSPPGLHAPRSGRVRIEPVLQRVEVPRLSSAFTPRHLSPANRNSKFEIRNSPHQ
jgi:hypothetical protein